uniref:ANK_REP_REGION domain-containing protein n=1 Tax=Macrostomum lignano TaxID=282301 RepID=A0A1I8JP99_9PLAT
MLEANCCPNKLWRTQHTQEHPPAVQDAVTACDWYVSDSSWQGHIIDAIAMLCLFPTAVQEVLLLTLGCLQPIGTVGAGLVQAPASVLMLLLRRRGHGEDVEVARRHLRRLLPLRRHVDVLGSTEELGTPAVAERTEVVRRLQPDRLEQLHQAEDQAGQHEKQHQGADGAADAAEREDELCLSSPWWSIIVIIPLRSRHSRRPCGSRCSRTPASGGAGSGSNRASASCSPAWPNTDQEQIAIIAEDAEAEAAAEAAVEDRQAKSTLDEIAMAGTAPQISDRSQRTVGQQDRPRQSLAQQADTGSGAARAPSGCPPQLLLRASVGLVAGGGGGSGSGRPASPKLDNYLEEVPQPNRPRFSSSMSLEAQFAMMKSYESRLRSKILAANHRKSPDPPPGLRRPNVSLKQRPATSRDPQQQAASSSFVAAAAAAEAASNSRRRKMQRSQSLAPERSQISEETQLDLSRRLQFAQYLSDYFVIKQGEPCLNYGLLRDKKDFNPIKKFNWWSSWWSRDF